MLWVMFCHSLYSVISVTMTMKTTVVVPPSVPQWVHKSREYVVTRKKSMYVICISFWGSLKHQFLFIGAIYLQRWNCTNYHRRESGLPLCSGAMCFHHDVSTKLHTIPWWLHREYINMAQHRLWVQLNFDETVSIRCSNAKAPIGFCGDLILAVITKLDIGCLPLFLIGNPSLGSVASLE